MAGPYEAKKSVDKWFPVMLYNSADLVTRETAVSAGQTTFEYGYEGATALVSYTLTNMWRELGSGGYWLKVGASEFTTEGKYLGVLHASGCEQVDMTFEVADGTFAEQLNSVQAVSSSLNTYFAALTANQSSLSSDLITNVAALTAGHDVLATSSDLNTKFAALTAGHDLLSTSADLATKFASLTANQSSLSGDITALEMGGQFLLNGAVSYDETNSDVYANASLSSAGAIVNAGAWYAKLMDYDGTEVIGTDDWTTEGEGATDYVAYWRYNAASDVSTIQAGQTMYMRVGCTAGGNAYSKDIFAVVTEA